MFWLLTWSSGKDVSGIQNINTIKKRQGKQKNKTALSLSIFVVCSKTKSILGCLALSRKTKNWGKQTNSKTNRIPGWSQKKFFLFVFLGFFVLLIYTGQSCFFPQILFFLKVCYSYVYKQHTTQAHVCTFLAVWKATKTLGKKTAKKRSFKRFLFLVGGGLAYIHIHIHTYIYILYVYIYIYITRDNYMGNWLTTWLITVFGCHNGR